jgi:hypothetical protein
MPTVYIYKAGSDFGHILLKISMTPALRRPASAVQSRPSMGPSPASVLTGEIPRERGWGLVLPGRGARFLNPQLNPQLRPSYTTSAYLSCPRGFEHRFAKDVW